MHGADQSGLRKLLFLLTLMKMLPITLGHYVSHERAWAILSGGWTLGYFGESAWLRGELKADSYRAPAASDLIGEALAGRTHGSAAINRCVYSCCGREKIRWVGSHSTIAPW